MASSGRASPYCTEQALTFNYSAFPYPLKRLLQPKTSAHNSYQGTMRKISNIAHLRISKHSSGGGKNLHVRFKLDTQTEAGSLLLDPLSPLVVRWKAANVWFLAYSFFRIPMVSHSSTNTCCYYSDN